MHSHWKDLAPKFTAMIGSPDKEVILGEWRKMLPLLNEENIAVNAFGVELRTLTVIESHISELSKHSSYSVLASIKHAAKSICILINKLLAVHKFDSTIEDRIESILVPLITDIRTEYFYEISKQTLRTMVNGDKDTDLFKTFKLPMIRILKVSYRLLIDSAELAVQNHPGTPNESVVLQVVNFWGIMLTEPMGVNAMHHIFYETKFGSLVQVLLSFTNTSYSQEFASKVLEFFENLFKVAENPDSPFKIDELCICISELAYVDKNKLTNWLSHILIGPSSGRLNVSRVSSNVATPTNMASTSAAIPSTSGQILPIDNDAMDIDYECSIPPVSSDFAGEFQFQKNIC